MNTPTPFRHKRAMIGQIASDTDAALPAMPRGAKSRQLPRLFQITYTATRFHLKQTHTLWGTQYPNGCIALENGVVFGDGMIEMEEHFKRAGTFEVQWIPMREVQEGE